MTSLRDLQMTEFEILCKLDSVCKKNRISYSLAFGSALGAVRHDGFIPWDDDIDVMMGHKDYKKLLKLKKNELGNFFLSSYKTEKEFPMPFTKLRKNNTKMEESCIRFLNIHTGVWVDIFPFTYAAKGSALKKAQSYLLGIYCTLHYKYLNKHKMENNDEIVLNSKLCKVTNALPDWLIKPLKTLFFNLACFVGTRKSGIMIQMDEPNNNKKIIDIDSIENTVLHKFELGEFPIPLNYDKYLKKLYGDYMVPVKSHIHVNLEKVEL
ncbi:MAG TPA: LicD family protein [Clostridia bacterium]|nr:LicD family protein [Clostridia bacterium]